MYGWRFTSQPLADHIGVSELLIITTSNSPPWVDTSAVILARASFSGSETKLRWMSGCRRSKRGGRLVGAGILQVETVRDGERAAPDPGSRRRVIVASRRPGHCVRAGLSSMLMSI